MRIRDRLGISQRTQDRISRSLQVLMFAIGMYGLYTGNISMLVNAAVGLTVTFLPAILERDHGIVMDPVLVLWLTGAMAFHVIGVLGPYRSVWWWDHIAHSLSSSVVAAAGYAAFRAIELHSDEIVLPKRLFGVFLLIFVMAFGVIWEVLEFGIAIGSNAIGAKPVLTQYGLEDTMKDLLFDMLGGLIVVILGGAHFVGVIDDIAARLETITPGEFDDILPGHEN